VHFSACPIYAAFPVCKMLLKKGASVSNIVVMLSTWAVIKIPMLANEAKFLGPKFMVMRWVLTTFSIFTMAYITSKIVKKEDMPMDDILSNENGSILYVNDQYCIGCGICTKIAPDNFIIENKVAMVTHKVFKFDENGSIEASIDKCPSKAIGYKNNI
jgi:ferredoxin